MGDILRKIQELLENASTYEETRTFGLLINTTLNANYHTQNTPRSVVATPSFRNSVDKPSTDGASFVMTTKYCKRCDQHLPLSEFYTLKDCRYTNGKTKLATYCRKCANIKLKEKSIERYNASFVESLEGEIWKPVVGYENFYSVSSLGRVKRIKHIIDRNGAILHLPEKLLSIEIKPLGYKYVKLKDGKSHSVHRLVATSFIPKPEGKDCVNHKDFNPSNNHVSNLEWVTHQENIQHSSNNGRFVNVKFPNHLKRKPIMIKNLSDGSITEFESKRALAKHLGVRESVFRTYMINNKPYKNNLIYYK
jgi:hypothetical protein